MFYDIPHHIAAVKMEAGVELYNSLFIELFDYIFNFSNQM